MLILFLLQLLATIGLAIGIHCLEDGKMKEFMAQVLRLWCILSVMGYAFWALFFISYTPDL
jgi:hypothetical protein